MKSKRLLVIMITVLVGLFLFVTNGFADTNNENSPKGVPQRLTDLENLYTSLKQSSVSDQAEISTLKDTISTQNNLISSLTANISDVKSQVTSLQTQLQQLQSKVEELEARSNPPASVGHTISGTMVDSNNKPFFSGIELIGENGQHYPRTSGDINSGQFSFDHIPDGTYSVHYYYSQYSIASPRQVTVSGTDVTGLIIKLAVPTYTISGQALSNSGSPITEQTITLRDPHNLGGYWQPTGNDGSFTMGGIAPGSYTILIGNPDSPIASADITITDHDITDLRIIGTNTSDASQPKVTGNVFGTDGTPVPGVNLRFFDEGGYYSTSTDNNGHYEINVREARSYPLIVAEQGYMFASKSNITVNTGTPAQVDLKLSQGGTIAGTISYIDGVQAQYVSIKVLDENNNLVNRIYVNADSSYQLNAPAGTYTLLVETSTGKSLNAPVTVTTGQTLTQNFTL
jgi:uncharacterized coiled-coil protein SlyX